MCAPIEGRQLIEEVILHGVALKFSFEYTIKVGYTHLCMTSWGLENLELCWLILTSTQQKEVYFTIVVINIQYSLECQ